MDRARAGVLGFRGGVVAYAFFVDGCSTRPGRGFIARMASEQSEHRWVWVGGERSSLGGVKDHERSEYRTGDLLLWEQGVMIRNMSGANTALFWSVKSLWSGMERQRNGG